MDKCELGEISKLRIWALAARPKTLPAAITPVIVGSAVALSDGAFNFFPAAAALLAALLLQIGANLANDLFDYKKGADTSGRLGPMRVTQQGLLTPGEVAAGTTITFSLAAVIGIYLACVGGWPIVLIGVSSILSALLYTGGPFPYGYHGLGEIFVFIFFGPVAVCGTYFIQSKTISTSAIWSAIPIGLLITAILVVNNLRDINTDKQVGKNTIAVRLGESGTRIEYSILVLCAYLIPLLMWIFNAVGPWIMSVCFSLPLAVSAIKNVYQRSGIHLNQTLADTGRLTFVYGILFSIGIILG